MKFISFNIVLLLLTLQLLAQNNKQNIRGNITDKQSQQPLKGAIITILDSTTSQSGISDERGNFLIDNIQPNRYDIKVSFIGYRDAVLSNIVVTSGKETILDIALEEKINKLDGINVKGKANKARPINDLASISARTFSTEEVNRYAGGRSDPGRLVSNFAGVSTPNDARNDIVIRGNAPTGVLWRIEGMNIPNPNHFATIGSTGGPVSALNTNMLKNSDFFTSAFPAEYGNATAGVFDLGFRKGNTAKREHTFQLGALTGLEAMTEGPIKKGNGSSYLIAYRYSFTGVAQAMGIPVGTAATPFYQDLTFKISSGNGKLGRFTIFGLGGKSNIEFKHDNIDSTDLFADPSSDSYFKSNLGMVGLKHNIKISEKAFFNTIIGVAHSSSEFLLDTVNKTTNEFSRATENITGRNIYNIHTTYNQKVNAKLFIKMGVLSDITQLDLRFKTRINLADWAQLWDYNDATTLTQVYAHAKYNFSDKTILNIGLHGQYLSLNGSKALEPRLGLKQYINEKHSISLGYGLHSQMQTMDVYFYRHRNFDGTYDESNRELDFTRSHHFAIAHDWQASKDWRLKTEIYYQSIFNVPISRNSNSFSMLNNGASFNPTNESNLINNGTGENYGLEVTAEKFFSQGYYGLLTTTFYESKYKGSDNIKRNTAFNGRHVINLLLGKEIKVGHSKQNTFSGDIKFTTAGGRYFTPVDLAASQIANTEILQGDAFAFSERNPSFFRLDAKIGYSYNSSKKKIAQSIFFDIQNITNHKNVFAQRYNTLSGNVNTAYQIGFFPNFVYKLQF